MREEGRDSLALVRLGHISFRMFDVVAKLRQIGSTFTYTDSNRTISLRPLHSIRTISLGHDFTLTE